MHVFRWTCIQCIWISHHQFWSKSSVVYILIPQNEIIFINHNFWEILERVGLILWFTFKVFNDASFEVLGQLTQCYGCPLQTVWQPKSFTDELGNSSFQVIHHTLKKEISFNLKILGEHTISYTVEDKIFKSYRWM